MKGWDIREKCVHIMNAYTCLTNTEPDEAMDKLCSMRGIDYRIVHNSNYIIKGVKFQLMSANILFPICNPPNFYCWHPRPILNTCSSILARPLHLPT